MEPEPQTIVLFGATGDLSLRKAMPALYNLLRQGMMPDRFAVLGVGRSGRISQEQFRQLIRGAVARNSVRGHEPRAWVEFEPHLKYFSGDYSDPAFWSALKQELERVDAEFDIDGRRLFYCATPPSVFPVIARGLAKAGLGLNSRIVIEKPFGNDLASARELTAILHDAFDEKQIFRIDHYLGKETVQNILVFRFANGIFEPLWNRRYIDSVQIEVAESMGMSLRGEFYEEAGAIRDVLQNHMMQLLATLTMEPPAQFDPESIRNEKVKLLQAVPPIDPAQLVRGQYTGGVVEGTPALAYREEDRVSRKSMTETFAVARLQIENWRWSGVPFYLRTGKRLPRRATTITMMFKGAPHMLFEESGLDRPEQNRLIIRVQPDEGITLAFGAKAPGPDMEVTPVKMHFDYRESFSVQPPEAYERLLSDAMAGDGTLFTRADETERSWEIVARILEPTPPLPYPAGTWGPSAADDLIAPGRWQLSEHS